MLVESGYRAPEEPGSAVLLSALLACTPGGGECSTLEQPDRDYCYSDRIESMGPEELDAVREVVLAIEDPLVREASVLAWLGVHADSVPLEEAESLCAVSGGEDSWLCKRRLHAAHLRREEH